VKPKALLIESSTLSTSWVQQLAAEAADRACAFLDAPVTGSKPQAESGELVFLVGEIQPSSIVHAPVLQVMSREIIHLAQLA